MNFQANLLTYAFFITLPVSEFYACKQAPVSNNVENLFYYFPETNVYYNEAAGLYYYSLDSGKNWSSYPYDSSHKKLFSENKITISVNNNEPVWKQNDIHIRTYNGNRLAILSGDTGMSQPEKIALKLTQKTSSEKADSVNAVAEVKKPNFFQRIFGKKKKKN